MKNRWLNIFLVTILFLGSCVTRAQYGDRSNWSAEMHFKVAQDAANRKAYKQALEEYDEILEKFADSPEKVAMANYEKAVILLRMKKYDESYAILQALKADMDDPMKFASMPPWLHIMVPIMYDIVEEKVFEIQNKQKKAEEKRKAKEDAKAQKERIKQLEKEKKEQEKKKVNQPSSAMPTPEDEQKSETPSSTEKTAPERESEQTEPEEPETDEQEDDNSANDDEQESEKETEWQPFEPFMPLE